MVSAWPPTTSRSCPGANGLSEDLDDVMEVMVREFGDVSRHGE